MSDTNLAAVESNIIDAKAPSQSSQGSQTASLSELKDKKGLMSSLRVALWSVVLILLLQSVTETFKNIQTAQTFESSKQIQAKKIAEINAAKQQLQGIGGKLAALAAAGNQNAVKIVTQFEKAGVTMRPLK